VKIPSPGSLDYVPPAAELFGLIPLADRHPGLLPENRLRWMARNRHTNGLLDARAIFESPVGELIFHEPATINWLLGLSGRAKPRRVRKQSAR
jgi:hypothetical protein